MRRENGRKEMDDEQQQSSTDLFENKKKTLNLSFFHR